MKDFINRIYNSNYCGKFRIVRELLTIGIENDRWYEIEFLDTKYRMQASYNAIRHGNVKDKFVPSVAGIGYIGSQIKITDPIYYNLYKAWNDMMNRCYNMKDNDYYLYGAIGIRVSEDWFNFTTFQNDVRNIPGYENKVKYPNEYQLDKDYLQFGIPKSQRIYSKETCIWLSKHDNVIIMNKERKYKI